MQLNLTQEDLVYITAAVGRVHDPPNVNLFEYLYDELTTGERHNTEELMKLMEFSNRLRSDNRGFHIRLGG